MTSGASWTCIRAESCPCDLGEQGFSSLHDAPGLLEGLRPGVVEQVRS